MSRIFVFSDPHFGHANILKFTNFNGGLVRPEFSSIEEMDETIVANINKVVTEQDDILYCLGDVFFGEGHKHIQRLKGRKRLIVGNHDNIKSPHLLNNFQKILLWRMFPEYNCLLTHVPVHQSTLYKCKWNVHGHIHRNPSPPGPYINVSVEMINYTPILLEDLIKNAEMVEKTSI